MYYVVQVKAGKEQTAIMDINKYKSEDSDYDVFSPFRKVVKKIKGEYREVTERCFPGYVFVETSNPKNLFHDLYWVPGYTRLLGREGLTENFVPLNLDESRMIDILYNKNNNRTTEISDIEVIEGEKIVILDGVLMDQRCVIKKVNLHKRTVTVEFTLCGRPVKTDVGINIITKVYD